MIVNRRDVDSMLPKRARDGIDLFVDQHEITGDGCLAIGERLKVQRRHHAHGRQERLPHFRDGLGPGHRDLVDAGTDVSPLASHELLDLLRVALDA